MKSLNEIFDEINEEARNGLVSCGAQQWLYYSTLGSEFRDVKKHFKDTIVPCLKITDKENLLDSIKEYLEVAECFYGELDYDGVSDVDKYTIATVLSNLTYEDFNNPTNFFRYRKKFLEDDTLSYFFKNRNIGHSEIFDADIEVEIRKEVIFLETPYGVYINLVKTDENGRKIKYPLPVIRYGVADNVVYFYAIQKDQSLDDEKSETYDSFCKKIRRKMYKVNSNLPQEEKDNDDIDNIKEVSPWSLIALTIFLGLIKKEGLEQVKAFPLLINRWNSNVIYSQEMLRSIRDKDDECYNEYRDYLILLRENMDVIQKNISDKFIRTFRRLAYHFPGIKVNDYYVPMGLPLNMNIVHGEDCNNNMLQEMFNMGYNYEYDDIKSKRRIIDDRKRKEVFS